MSSAQEPLTTEQLFSRTKQRRQLLFKRQGVILAAAVIVFILAQLHSFDRLEAAALDAWLSRVQHARQTDVVLVSISKKSIDQIGAWPWPSFRYAVALEFLGRLNARSVYFHEPLLASESEKEREALTEVLEKQQLKVFLPAEETARFENALPGLPAISADKKAQLKWQLPPADFMKSAWVGHRKIEPDADRKFRFWQPRLRDREQFYELAALKMYELNNEKPPTEFLENRLLIPWNRARFDGWPRIEFSDLIQNYFAMREGMKPLFPAVLFAGKDIFIGLADENHTSMGLAPWGKSVFPYEVMAAVYDGLDYPLGSLRGEVPPLGRGVFLAGLILLVLIWTGLRLGGIYWTVLAGLIFLTVLIWLALIAFGIWLPWVTPFLFFAFSALCVFVFDALNARQERSALFHLATRDGLTNLYVIRHFRVIMNQMTREACARKESLTVILMDIDHFKKINDTYGHPAGDMVLKKTADLIQGAVRQKRILKEIDFVARYGGEEFIILIRRNSLQNTAQIIAERIRAAIASAHYDWNGTKISVTASFGVSVLRPEETVPDPMVHRADKALYFAKQSGRNRVCTEDELPK